MTSLTIDHALAARLPDLALGVIFARVSAAPSDSAWQEAVARAARLRASSCLAETLASEPIVTTREALRCLGRDPSRWRASNEALVRRVFADKGIPTIVPVVDLNNAVSISSLLPCGVYDLDRLHGDVVFRAGIAGERYQGIGKGKLELSGIPVLADAAPFGSPVSDSRRTLISDTTQRVMMVVMSFAGASRLPSILDAAVALLTSHVQATDVERAICKARP